ncbi:hypothetical protein BgiBS90_021816 [Biomphalaria glabrata]|nr:hypothetical protein BgiBS90_021816 [Biomphalaria glabrata]
MIVVKQSRMLGYVITSDQDVVKTEQKSHSLSKLIDIHLAEIEVYHSARFSDSVWTVNTMIISTGGLSNLSVRSPRVSHKYNLGPLKKKNLSKVDLGPKCDGTSQWTSLPSSAGQEPLDLL